MCCNTFQTFKVLLNWIQNFILDRTHEICKTVYVLLWFGIAGWETSARPLTNASENLAGRVENRAGRVEFCIGYIRDHPVRTSAKKLSFPACIVDFSHFFWLSSLAVGHHIDGLVQERRTSSVLAMELHLFWTSPSIYTVPLKQLWRIWVNKSHECTKKC